MTPPTTHPGPGQSVLPPVVARVVRDVLLVLGLGLAVALLRAVAAGADPGGGVLPTEPAPPAVTAERAAARPTLLDDLLAPVRQLVAPEPSTPAPAPSPLQSPPTPMPAADPLPVPAAEPAPTSPAPPAASPAATDPNPATLGELLAPLTDLLDTATAPLVPVVTAVLEPLRPVFDLVAPALPGDVAEALPPFAAPPLAPPEIERPGLGASWGEELSVPTPLDRPALGPTSLPAARPLLSPSSPSIPEPAPPPTGEMGPGLAPPVDAVPSAPASGSLGSPPGGATPSPCIAAVLTLIETPAVVAAGLVVPSSTDGTSATCPRPGFSPD